MIMGMRTKKDLVASIYTETEWKVSNPGINNTEEERLKTKKRDHLIVDWGKAL